MDSLLTPFRALYHRARLRRGRPRLGSVLERLRESQWWSPETLETHQLARLRDTLVLASARIPFYRDRLSVAGMDPRSDPLPTALLSIPPLSREDLERHFHELEDPEARPQDRIVSHTGGSTGTPTTVLLDRADIAASRAEQILNAEWTGIRPGVRHAFLWGADRDSWPYRGLKGAIKRKLECLLWINTFDLLERDLDEVVERLRRFEPRVLVGYASSLRHLARTCLEMGTTIPSVSSIQSSAETLTASDRRLLARAFHAEIFDRYGSRELANIAHECSAHSGLHLNSSRLWVEIVTESGIPAAPGETGRVLVTTLLRRSMPLIRYDVGDLAVATEGSCACGRGLPRIGGIQGRVSDVIRGPSGRLLHGEFFTHLFYGVPGVRRFQVVQEDARRLVISLVVGPRAAPDVLATLRTRVLEEGDPGFDVQVRLVDAIQPSPTGKYRFTFSRHSRIDEPVLASEESGARSA